MFTDFPYSYVSTADFRLIEWLLPATGTDRLHLNSNFLYFFPSVVCLHDPSITFLHLSPASPVQVPIAFLPVALLD